MCVCKGAAGYIHATQPQSQKHTQTQTRTHTQIAQKPPPVAAFIFCLFSNSLRYSPFIFPIFTCKHTHTHTHWGNSVESANKYFGFIVTQNHHRRFRLCARKRTHTPSDLHVLAITTKQDRKKNIHNTASISLAIFSFLRSLYVTM